MKHVCWIVAFIAFFAFLILSDHFLRKIENSDALVLQGQTGLSVIDSFLSTRAAKKLKNQKLKSDLADAKSTSERIKAHYNIFHFEVENARESGRVAIDSLNAIINEGKSSPETLEAWHELFLLAQGNKVKNTPEDSLRGYFLVIKSLNPKPDKLNRLLDVWKIADQWKFRPLKLETLEYIQHEFSASPSAIPAYEALLEIYRKENRQKEMEAVEHSLDQARRIFLLQKREEEMGRQIGVLLERNQIAHAEQVLFSMSPGLSPLTKYWSLYSRFLKTYQEANQWNDVERIIFKICTAFPPDLLDEDDKDGLWGAAAILHSEKSQWNEAAEAIAKAPCRGQGVRQWKDHLQIRHSFANKETFPTNIISTILVRTQTPPTNDESTSSSGWGMTWQSIPNTSTNSAASTVSTSWRATYDASNLYVQINCDEPFPEKIQAKYTEADKNIPDDDSIEIFVNSWKTDATYYHLASNFKGVLLDEKCNRTRIIVPPRYNTDVSWDSKCKVSVQKTSKGWNILYAIPWSTLNIQPSDGGCFLNVKRNRWINTAMESYAWDPLIIKIKAGPLASGFLQLK